jgi:ribosomal-protein-alanine N-acetyltransferase
MVRNYKEVLYENEEIETDRLLLRKFKKEDASDILEYGSCEQTQEHIMWEGVKALDEAVENIVNYYWSRPGIFAIELKENGKCVGCIDLRLEPEHEKTTFGFILNHNYWNKGYMSEVLSTILEFCFDKLDLNRVEACYFVGNEGSGKVMKKCGMKQEGIRVKSEKVKGVFRDVVNYGMTKEDWNLK